MENRTRIALYPMFADTIPVARYFLKYRHDVEVVELIAPKGSCVCGKDASFLDNRESLGLIVQSFDQAHVDSWDVLYLMHHDTIGLDEEALQHAVYDPMIKIAKAAEKRIIGYPFSDNTWKRDVDDWERSISGSEKNTLKKHGTIKQIKTFLVFVGGVIAEANAFEIMLGLYGELKKNNRVIAFSSSMNAEVCGTVSIRDLLYTKKLTDEQKVIAIEKQINQISKKEKADIILLQLDEPLLPFSDTLTSGFGIIPYIVSQVIIPDYCICCLPYSYVNPTFIQQFEQGLDGRFAFVPDRWHMSNAALDYTTVTSIRDAGAIHVPITWINGVLQAARENGINVGCDVLPEYLFEAVESIQSTLRDNQIVTSIL